MYVKMTSLNKNALDHLEGQRQIIGVNGVDGRAV